MRKGRIQRLMSHPWTRRLTGSPWIRWVGARRWAQAVSVGVVVACVLGTLLTSLLTLAHRSAVSTPPQHHRRVVVHGVLPPALGHAKRLRAVEPTTALQISIGLRLAHAQDFQTLVAGVQDPKSKLYRQYLTPQTFTSRFAPAQSDVAAVTSFLRSAGLRVTSVSADRLLIDATGTAMQVERAFGITIDHYQLGKHTYYAPDREPTVPDNIAPMILNIGGLDNLFHMSPHFAINHHNQTKTTGGAPPTSSLTGPFSPTDLQNAYDVGPLLAPTYQANTSPVGVFELAPYIPGDISTYRGSSGYNLPSSPINAHSVDGATVTCAAAVSACDVPGIGEADLDLEVISAIAPYATQEVFTGPNTTQGVNDTYNALITARDSKNAPLVHVITTSWGLCEPFSGQAELNQLDTMFALAKSNGQTVFAAAGDAGTDDCQLGGDGSGGFGMPPTVDSPASDPYVVAVGGTSLTLNGSGTYGSEAVWNDAYGATGGGPSSYYSLPTWQIGAGVSKSGQRQVPDVAADADPNTGYSIYCSSYADCANYGWLEFGGTSAAAPLWAAIYSDIDTYYGQWPSHSAAHFGWVNQELYNLFAFQQSYSPYQDVTATGNNDLDYTSAPFAGEFPVTTCYDMTTGMGSPDAYNIARDITGIVSTAGSACAQPTTTPTNLIQDGGFENATSGWQQFSLAGQPVVSTLDPHGTSVHAFLACGYPGCDDRVWQTVTVPASVSHATLSFWVDGVSSMLYLTSSPPCLDHFYVTLATPDGTVFDTVQATCKFYAYGYTLESIDVTTALQAHLNQPVVLLFRGTAANEAPFAGLYSYWAVDDVALNVSQ